MKFIEEQINEKLEISENDRCYHRGAKKLYDLSIF